MLSHKVNEKPIRLTKAAQPFHHGRLRAALLQAALKAIESSGHHSLSMRELATELGVSSAAPYRHFGDRLELLSAVACIGYGDVRRLHVEAMRGGEHALGGLRRAMRGFLKFAKQRPHLFQLMYSDLVRTPRCHPDLLAAEANLFALVSASLAAALPHLDEPALRLRMATSWATLYGQALIGGRNMIRPYMTKGLSESQIDAAVIDAAIGPVPAP